MSLERTFIKLSNGAKIMDISNTQPKLLDAKHACGRKFQMEKSTLEVHGHISTQSSYSSTSSLKNEPFCFCYYI